MKLNTDLRVLIRGKKQIYPTKRSMNLYFKVDRTTAPATAVLYGLFALVLLLALSKLMIFDPWTQATQLKEDLLSWDQLNASQLEELADYDEILEDYLRATPTQEELSQVDRLEILALIDKVIRPYAAISQVSISQNQVLLSFSGITLQQAGSLVSNLEQSPLVTNISVDTAVAAEGENFVEVNVFFEVAGEEESAS